MSETPLRYFLQIAYRGTRYHGWQQQRNATTVQGILQTCLSQILRNKVQVVGSSRTDKGVHAQQQFAHIDLACAVEISRLHYQLNAVLPSDIAIVAIKRVSISAHARFDALARTYAYTLVQEKSPFQNGTSYFLRGVLDIPKMNEAASILRCKKDFRSLCKVRSEDVHFLCTILESGWVLQKDRLVFRIKATRFLRSMVRIIVSLLLKIGQGKLSLSEFEALIERKERDLTINLVPAQGLTLMQVDYAKSIFLV